MTDHWRPQATAAIVFVVLLPLWVVASWSSVGDSGVILTISSLLVVAGLACALAGVRRGSLASRLASWICLSALLLLVAFVAAVLASLIGQRFA
jgi:hypothetical protein